MKERSFKEIHDKLENGTAVVMTASELLSIFREDGKAPDVDVVTCGTKGIMSGTMANLSFKAADKNVFIRAKGLCLNGIPAYPGPCPNERLGIVDAVLYGTSHSVEDENYGGGHLFRDLASGNEIDVELETESGKMLRSSIRLADMQQAQLISTRNAFKNYVAYVNPLPETLEHSIFSVKPFTGPYKELKFCGCGELNPVEKDPGLDVIGIGTKVLINGSTGIVTGHGSRSTPEKPNLSAISDLKAMDPSYLGGFITSAGPEAIMSWAVPIPVLSDSVLKNLLKIDEEIPLSVVDVRGRDELGRITYGDVWRGCDLVVKLDPGLCEKCVDCEAGKLCPTGALSIKNKKIDRKKCFNCGTCVGLCPEGAITANMGSVNFNGMKIPITERHSDRLGAMKISLELKRKLLSGEFKISDKIERIKH